MSANSAPGVAVWDRAVLVLHWALVLAVFFAWTTTLGAGRSSLHEPAGYAALAVVTARVIWGFIGSPHARFAQFVRPFSATVAYLRLLRDGSEPHYAGHNPLGAWMIVALLTCVACAGASGWLFTTDRFWGVEWVWRTHVFFAWLLLALIVLHLGGVIFTSLRQRENLVAAMFTGRKKA